MENKLLLITRYFTIFVIIIGIASYVSMDLNFLYIILILLFIISTQLRYFLFMDKSFPVFITLLIDYIIGHIIISSYDSLLLPFFILIILDCFLLIKNNLKYLALTIGFIDFIYLGMTLSLQVQLAYISTIIMIILIASYTLIIKNKQTMAEELYQELRKSEDKLIKANKELELYADSIKELTLLQERNRISREIHDSIGHSLSTIIIQLGAIEKIGKKDGSSASLMAANLRDFAKAGLEEIRKALKELKPKEFEDYETLLVIESLTKNFSKLTGIDVKLGFSKSKWQVDEKTSLVIYRTVQEFLSNSSRHGKATKINVFIHFDDESLILTMQDNGIGTDNIELGMGLNSLKERVMEIGGSVKLESSQGKGFFLRISLMPFHNAKM